MTNSALTDLAIPAPTATRVASSAPAGRYQPLGWFRLMLAGMVLVTHYSQNIAQPGLRDAIFPLSLALVGVCCFFVLSGFIIAEAVESFYSERPVSFIVNRMLRILPPVVAAVIVANSVFFALYVSGHLMLFHEMEVSGKLSFGISNVLRDLASLLPLPKNSLRPDVDALPMLWTLRIELMFYVGMFSAVCIASLLRMFGWVPYRRGMQLMLLTLAGLSLAGFVAWASGKAPPLLSYFVWFGLGVSLFYANRKVLSAWIFAAVFFVCSIWQFAGVGIVGRAAYQMNPLLRGQPVSPYVPETILICCLAIIVIVPYLKVSRFRKVDKFLGDLTYPIYLNHVTTGVIALSLFRQGTGAMIIAFLGALALSYTIDRLVEPISAKWRDRLRGKRLT